MDELLSSFAQICYVESSRNGGNFNTGEHSVSPT